MSNNETAIGTLKKMQIDWEVSDELLQKLLDQTDLTAFRESSLNEIEIAMNPRWVTLVSIYRSLQKIYPTADQQKEWLAAPNSTFNGFKPMHAMMGPLHDLQWVAYTLETYRRNIGI